MHNQMDKKGREPTRNIRHIHRKLQINPIQTAPNDNSLAEGFMNRNIHWYIDVIHQTTNNSLKMNMLGEEQFSHLHGAVK